MIIYSILNKMADSRLADLLNKMTTERWISEVEKEHREKYGYDSTSETKKDKRKKKRKEK